ncbi:zinc finger CCCH domain-containing protein 2-like protein [Tanacetum coccineum]
MQNTDQEYFMASGLNYLTNKKSLRDIDIPPRKLLSRRASASSATSPENYMDNMYHHQNEHSPRVLPEETLFKQISSQILVLILMMKGRTLMLQSFSVCMSLKVESVTAAGPLTGPTALFAQPRRELARCPRRYNYLGTVCADFRRGSCSRGDLCEFAHGVFECWLHPSRYRTEACKDGKNCQRKICFSLTSQRHLRVVPTGNL